MRKLIIKKTSLLFFYLTCSSLVFSQSFRSDFDLIQKKDSVYFKVYSPHPRFLFFPQHGILKYNPVSITFGSALYVYQRFLSKQVHAGCMFSPSCSEFSRLLIEKYGIIRGIIYSSDRLMRCNRIALGEADVANFDKNTQKIKETIEFYKLHGK